MRDFIGGAPIVAHAYENERDFLDYEFARAKVIEWGDSAYGEERYICTQILYEQIFPGATKSLTSMCDRLALDAKDQGEVVKGPDISKDFALYRYIPHNSVLWLLTAGGPLGFFLLWSLFVVGIYLAARAHRLSSTPEQRMAALGALSAQTLFLIQAFGDMGTQNWSTTWILGAALAVAGALAVETGAWPARTPVLELEAA